MQTDPHPFLPSLDVLLSSGGDARIAPDPFGCNKYGCFSVPKLNILSYGSSTASTISTTSYAAVTSLYQHLKQTADREEQSVTYARETERIRQELISLSDLGSLSGLDIVLGSSGTDLHLLAAQLMRKKKLSLLVVIPETSETGSGVPAAIEGYHFSSCASYGGAVSQGQPIIKDDQGIDVVAIESRSETGALRPVSLVDAEAKAAVLKAVEAGQHVLINMIDVSKTGLVIPSLACVLDLKQRFPDKVDVLVDGCQFRLSNTTIRAYLEHGFLLAITGSKFMTGPAFSAALLVPQSVSLSLHDVTLPSELAFYSASADWPLSWATRSTLPEKANYGVVLRWEAALAEWRTFHALSEKDIKTFLGNFAEIIQKRLSEDPALEPVAVGDIKRDPMIEPLTWDHIPTIFPFLIRHQGSEKSFMSREKTHRLYELLREDLSNKATSSPPTQELLALRCQVGQPVLCGIRDGTPVSALRLCLDMRLIVDALSPRGRGREAVIADALRVLDKAALLTRDFLVGA